MADISILLNVRDSDYPPLNKLGSIPCNGFSYDTSTSGKTYPNIIVQRDLDGASAILSQAANMGAGFSWVEIEIDKPGPDGSPMPWSSFRMGKGSFVSDQVTGGSGGSKTEVLVLSYKDLKFDNVHNANGQTTPPDKRPWYVISPMVGG
jgi:hypothetical protein